MPEIPTESRIISNQEKNRKKKTLLSILIGASLIGLGVLIFFTLRTKTESIYPVEIKKATPSAETINPKTPEKKKTTKKPPTQKPITYPIKVPVLVLKYFPKPENSSSTMYGMVSEMRAKTDGITKQLIKTLEKGSTYHAYKNSKATPSLDYLIVETKEFLKKIPLSSKFPERGDKFKMFSDSSIGVSDICDYVDSKGVKEVWIWMYHVERTRLGNITIPKTTPTESNMAMGKNSRGYWNYGSFGDVSNSARSQDLPICKKTYTVYEYNYGRQLSEATENHMHHIEALLNWVDGRNKTSSREWKNLLFWGKFVGSDSSHKVITPGCGWAHYPPNGESDYDWQNTKYVKSDCEDWKPDLSGKKQRFNCNKWDCDSVKFFEWWMQNLPGKNNALTYKGRSLINWWDFIGAFDQAIKREKSLTN